MKGFWPPQFRKVPRSYINFRYPFDLFNFSDQISFSCPNWPSVLQRLATLLSKVLMQYLSQKSNTSSPSLCIWCTTTLVPFYFYGEYFLIRILNFKTQIVKLHTYKSKKKIVVISQFLDIFDSISYILMLFYYSAFCPTSFFEIKCIFKSLFLSPQIVKCDPTQQRCQPSQKEFLYNAAMKLQTHVSREGVIRFSWNLVTLLVDAFCIVLQSVIFFVNFLIRLLPCFNWRVRCENSNSPRIAI